MDDLSVALTAARAGAAVVRAGLGAATAAGYKRDRSPVTAIDRAAEEAILAVIIDARPDDAVVAEEGGDRRATRGARRWIVDPLDGTVNFLHGIPQVAVSVACFDADEGLAGVVIDVVRGEVFSAVRGEGTRLDGVPVRVSDCTDLTPAVIATGFPYDHRDHADDYAAALGGVLARVQGVRRFGSAALDMAWVACGRFDGYFELGVAPWDVAAGLVLVAEAGGTVSSVDGAPAVLTTGLVVAAGPGIHEELRQIVAGRLPRHLR